MFLLTHLQLYNCGKITTSKFFKNSVVADGLGNFPSAKTFEITFGTWNCIFLEHFFTINMFLGSLIIKHWSRALTGILRLGALFGFEDGQKNLFLKFLNHFVGLSLFINIPDWGFYFLGSTIFSSPKNLGGNCVPN